MQEQEVSLSGVDSDSRQTTNFDRYAMDIVRECAEAWERLITGKTPKGDISL